MMSIIYLQYNIDVVKIIKIYSLVISRSHPNFQRGPPQGRLWPCRVRRCRPPLGWCSGQSPRRCETKTLTQHIRCLSEKEQQLRKKKKKKHNTFLHFLFFFSGVILVVIFLEVRLSGDLHPKPTRSTSP